ncbi:hypothetical protein CORC01_09175, partial [Colletotrichum orchidophilum]
ARCLWTLARHFPAISHLASANQTTPEPELSHLHRHTHSPRVDNTFGGISLPCSQLGDIGRGSHPDDPDGCKCTVQSTVYCLQAPSSRVTGWLLVGNPCSLPLQNASSNKRATRLLRSSAVAVHRPWSINVVRQYNRVRASQPDNPPVVRYERARHDTAFLS